MVLRSANERLRHQLYVIIFGSNTRSGRIFDIVLLYTIILSLLVVMIESVEHLEHSYGPWLKGIEWGITIAFTIEYILRIYIYPKPREYMLSFLGIVDFMAIFPTYFAFFFPGAQFIIVIRTLRLLRVFRVLKLKRYLLEIQSITDALKNSRYKLFVFMLAVVSIILIVGTMMYLIEGPENGFTSIPKSIYWSIVTITTVGYGDIAPNTLLGQILASILMFTGYSILAVPTGIITVEYSRETTKPEHKKVCPDCKSKIHSAESLFCNLCGSSLKVDSSGQGTKG